MLESDKNYEEECRITLEISLHTDIQTKVGAYLTICP